MPISFRSPTASSPVAILPRYAAALGQPSKAALLYASERQRARIISRTSKGVDVDGRAFAGYSDAYKKRKSKSGRNSGTVDLTWSGMMLKALVSYRQDPGTPTSSFTIGVYGSEGLRAAVHNEGRAKMPQRHFIGASAEDKRLMIADIAAHMMAAATGRAVNAA